MKRRRALLLVLISALGCTVSYSQSWSGIIDSTRAIDWTHAGATITNRTTACVTSACNTVSGGTVTTQSLNAAIVSAPANTVVNIPSGTFTITGGIHDTGVNNITLRGAGPLSTTLKFTGSGGCPTPGGAIDVCVSDSTAYYNGSSAVLPGGSNACQWTGGYAQGATSITLNSCGSKPPVNQFIVLDQASDTNDNGGVFVCNVASCNNEGAASQDGRTISGNNHAQQQFVFVTAVSGSGPYTVTLAAPGLYMNNWSEGGAFTGNQIGAWWPGMVQGVGIENLTLDHSSSGSAVAGVVFYDCYNCWVKNVRSIVNPSGSFSGRNHIWLYQSAFDTVRDSYFFGTHGNEEAYGIETLQESQGLFENNIFHYTTAPLMNGSGSGNVESYNYMPFQVFSFNQMNWQSAPFATHNAYTGMSLYEGNVGPSLIVDDDWGSGPVSATIFRNYWNGHTLGTQRGAFSNSTNYNPWDIVTYNGHSWAATKYIASGGGNPGSSNWFQLGDPAGKGTYQNSNAINLMWGARGVNVVGNVLGDSTFDTQYQLSPSVGSKGAADTSIYSLGFRGVQGGGASDNVVESSLMRWGNYDAVNNAVRWDSAESSPGAIPYLHVQSTPSSHSLPGSFYLNSQPGWWGTVPYPAIGPDVSGGTGPGGLAYAIPAEACYANGSFTNGILNFDANICYGGAGGINPPTGLAATVH
jgi:hypothetical protein